MRRNTRGTRWWQGHVGERGGPSVGRLRLLRAAATRTPQENLRGRQRTMALCRRRMFNDLPVNASCPWQRQSVGGCGNSKQDKRTRAHVQLSCAIAYLTLVLALYLPSSYLALTQCLPQYLLSTCSDLLLGTGLDLLLGTLPALQMHRTTKAPNESQLITKLGLPFSQN